MCKEPEVRQIDDNHTCIMCELRTAMIQQTLNVALSILQWRAYVTNEIGIPSLIFKFMQAYVSYDGMKFDEQFKNLLECVLPHETKVELGTASVSLDMWCRGNEISCKFARVETGTSISLGCSKYNITLTDMIIPMQTVPPEKMTQLCDEMVLLVAKGVQYDC
jgi:hypothetical protein